MQMRGALFVVLLFGLSINARAEETPEQECHKVLNTSQRNLAFCPSTRETGRFICTGDLCSKEYEPIPNWTDCNAVYETICAPKEKWVK